MRFLLATLLGFVVAGCGHAPPHIGEARLTPLSQEERAVVASATRNLEIARSNLGAAKLALNEAKEFATTTASDLQAARTNADSAHLGGELAWRSGNDIAIRDARYRE